jgi:hypothetical protein
MFSFYFLCASAGSACWTRSFNLGITKPVLYHYATELTLDEVYEKHIFCNEKTLENDQLLKILFSHFFI